MKLSQYISVLSISKDISIIFSARNDNFLIVKNSSVHSIDDIGSLCKTVDSRDLLVKNGILIEDCIDEVEELKNQILQRLNDSTVYQLHINPTLDCNFNCWYCYENHVKDSLMSPQTINATKNFISSKINRNLKTFDLSFFGGEPLMGFEKVAKPIMEHAKNLCKANEVILNVHFTTNAYLLSHEMIDFFDDFAVNFQITLDGHRDLHDNVRFPKGGGQSYDIILNNISKLAERNHHIIVRINYTAKNIDSAKYIAEDFSKFSDEAKKNIMINFQRVWQDYCDETDNIDSKVVECMHLLAEYGVRSNSHLTFNATVNPCYGDKKNYALINFDGNVFHCTARDFNVENRCGVLNNDGTISYDSEIIREREISKFTRENCHTCRIAPLCGGGCIQKNLEAHQQVNCVHGFSEEDKDRFILTRFEERYMKGKILVKS